MCIPSTGILQLLYIFHDHHMTHFNNAAIDCTRNIYGRLCSQISYFLPFECLGGGCEEECEDELNRRVNTPHLCS